MSTRSFGMVGKSYNSASEAFKDATWSTAITRPEKNEYSHIWTASGTDITVRWRLHGYVPPSELPEYQAKWKHFQELPLRKLDDQARKEYELVLKKAKVVRIR